jgi:AAA domain
MLPNASEAIPPTLNLTSQITSSEVRPKRSVIQRQTNDESNVKRPRVTLDEGGATIVSVESNSTLDDKKSSKKNIAKSVEKKKQSSTTKQGKSIALRKSPNHKVKPYKSSSVSHHSPTLLKTTSSTKDKSPAKQRVSLSPMPPPMDNQEVIIPLFEGSDKEKLSSCLDALHPAHRANMPTVCETTAEKSNFATNISKVSNFVQSVMKSRGRNGTGHVTDESSAALYICGSPGLGKTSGVNWCCDNVAKSTASQQVKFKVCHVNAAYLTSQATPLTLVINEVSKSLGMKTTQPSESAVLTSLRDTKKSAVLMIVIDEIDAFVTGGRRITAGRDCLRKLLSWANDPRLQIGLIGVSNCMNDDHVSEIGELGLVSADR